MPDTLRRQYAQAFQEIQRRVQLEGTRRGSCERQAEQQTCLHPDEALGCRACQEAALSVACKYLGSENGSSS